MTEATVPLFVPPSPTAPPISPSNPLRLQQIPSTGPHTLLTIVIAKIDHSGRIPAPDVIAAMHWAVGDRTRASVSTDAIIVRRATNERPATPIDTRRQLFIPAGARAQFGLRVGDQLLLVAIPDPAVLLAHPITVASSILAAYYTRQRYLWHNAVALQQD